MASLVGQQLKNTYDSLLKTSDNDALGGTYKEITDGSGNGSGLYLGTGGNVGIGETSPNAKLSVIGQSSDTVAIISSQASSSGSLDQIFLRGGSPVNYYDFTRDATSGALQIQGNQTGFNNIALAPVSGNVGIGLNNPQEKLTLSSGNADSCFLQVTNTDAGEGNNQGLYVGLTTDDNGYVGTRHNASLVFDTNNTEAMRIDSSGNVLVGKTVHDSGSTAGFQAQSNGQMFATASALSTAFFNRLSSDGDIMQFRKDGSTVGSISVTASATAYNTSSDYRLKENVVPMEGALDRVDQLKPSRFNFIADADTTVDGFLAHEVADIVPEAISGEKDAVDDEGNPIYQGIDQSKLVPLLVGAIQELRAEIEQLKAK